MRTLLIVAAEGVAQKATKHFRSMIHRMKELGLQVSAEKTEAVLFGGTWVRPDGRQPTFWVGRTEIQISHNIKYLGFIIDSKWMFEAHFKYGGEGY